MTDFWTRASMIALAGGALAACVTPGYPTAEGQAARAPLTAPRPNFPIVQETPAETTTAEAAPSQALPPPATAPAATAVSSQPLAPIAQSSPPAPQMVTTTRTIPVAAGRVVDAEGKPTMYEVQPGDTLYAISRKLGTTTAQLAEDNDLASPYRLSPGQRLKGPAPKTKAYTVTAGDTLFAIARRFSVRPQDIAEANEIALAAPINVGQRLLLPAGYRDMGPSSRTITSTQPRFDPPPQTPVYTPPTTTVAATPPAYTPPATTVAQTTTPATVPPAVTARPYTPPVTAKPYIPPASTVTPSAPRPYTPPAGTTATTVTRPYTPPATPMIQTGLPPTDTEVAAAGQGRFVWPVRGDVVSPFGPKGGGGQRNDGLNIRATAGTIVQAAAAGEVVYAGDQVPGFGNLVLVKHDSGWVTAYAHLNRIDVKMRDRVVQGQQLGQVGSTGGVGEPQLHFEVRYAPSPKDKARPVNPALVLPG